MIIGTLGRIRWLIEIVGIVLGFAALYGYHFLPGSGLRSSTQLFLIGVILVIGAFAGSLAQRIRLPRITGYLLIGAMASPSLPRLLPFIDLPTLVDPAQAKSLKLINDLAVGLIALMAGAEIRLDWLRARLRAILAIAGIELVLVFLLIFGVVLFAEDIPVIGGPMPFLDQGDGAGVSRVLVAALAAAIIVANSPTVVVSVLKETGARGPLSHTVMGVSVVMDAAVIFMFTIVVALIGSLGEASGGAAAAGGGVIASIAVSVAVGAGAGIGLAYFTERTDHRLSWTVIGVALAVAAIGPLIHLEPLFCLLAAGFACENTSAKRTPLATHRLESALKRVGTPVFVIFFVVAGLNIDLEALSRHGGIVVLLSLTRLAGVFLAVRSGARLSRTDAVVGDYAWIGMISQAGVTLALAQLAATRFPGWGDTMATFIVAMVALHEIVTPAAFAWSLRRAGETAETAAAAKTRPSPAAASA